MFQKIFQLFHHKKIVPEVLEANINKMPKQLHILIEKTPNNYYFVKIKNLSGCTTQARNSHELVEMVNDAVYTYFDIPEKYQAQVGSYNPPVELQKKLKATLQKKGKHELVFN